MKPSYKDMIAKIVVREKGARVCYMCHNQIEEWPPKVFYSKHGTVEIAHIKCRVPRSIRWKDVKTKKEVKHKPRVYVRCKELTRGGVVCDNLYRQGTSCRRCAKRKAA